MGQFRSTYVSPHAQSIAARIRVAPATSNAERALDKREVGVPAPKQVMPTDKVIRLTDIRESRVSHTATASVSGADTETKDKTAAVRRARWRKAHPKQHAEQQRAARARRKVSS